MNSEIKNMLKQTDPNLDLRDRVREVVQNLALYGLSNTGFRDRAVFYGGTALRLFHGLDRFSEDLDFSLRSPDPDFEFDEYLPDLENTLSSFGIRMEAKVRQKNVKSTIRSAFLKGNTKELVLEMCPDDVPKGILGTDITKIKFEVDIDPPPYARFERMSSAVPFLYTVDLYDLPSLFAGKLHAVLCRKWRNRVKGRDLYDFLFYMARDIPVNMEHLEARLRQTGCIGPDCVFDRPCLLGMLEDRLAAIDYAEAKKDVIRFVNRPDSLNGWNGESFVNISKKIRTAEYR